MKLFSEKLLMKKATELLTFTIEPTPSDALVVLTATGYTQVGNSISVPYNTSVDWSVSKNGYVSQNGTQIITNTTTRNVILEETSGIPLYVSILFYRSKVTSYAQYYANDLLNWTQNSSFPVRSDNSADRFFYFNKKFIITDSGSSKNYYTLDGLNWYELTTPNVTYKNNIYKAGERLFLGDPQGSYYTTLDGNNWVKLNQLEGMIRNFYPQYVGNRYFYYEYTSLDGLNWERMNYSFDSYFITYNGNFYFASPMNSGNFYKSTNGINWQQIEKPNSIYRLEHSAFSYLNTKYDNIVNCHVRCLRYKNSDDTYSTAIIVYDGLNFQIFPTTSENYIVGSINGNLVFGENSSQYLKIYDITTNQIINLTQNNFLSQEIQSGTGNIYCMARLSFENGYYFQDYVDNTASASPYIYYSTDLITWNQIPGTKHQIEYGEIDV